MPIEVYSTDTDSGVISVVTRKNGTHELVAQIPIGNAPRGAVKFTRDGRGFVSNTGGNTVSEIDSVTKRAGDRAGRPLCARVELGREHYIHHRPRDADRGAADRDGARPAAHGHHREGGVCLRGDLGFSLRGEAREEGRPRRTSRPS